jgi:hypothetical protein
MNEKLIEKKLREGVKRLGGQAIKFVSPGRAGVLDRLIVMPGGIAGFAETKTTGKKLTELQQAFWGEMTALGVKCWLIDDELSLQKFFSEVQSAHIPGSRH